MAHCSCLTRNSHQSKAQESFRTPTDGAHGHTGRESETESAEGGAYTHTVLCVSLKSGLNPRRGGAEDKLTRSAADSERPGQATGRLRGEEYWLQQATWQRAWGLVVGRRHGDETPLPAPGAGLLPPDALRLQ